MMSASMLFSAAAQSLNQDYLRYIDTYKQAAVNQELIHHIPACITLAQGLLESGAGKSSLAVEANNHFGIKCHSTWTGETFTHDDETANECFRKYANAEESFEDHAVFLEKPRYQPLFALDITDYKGWARGLKECGYATDPNYAPKLIKLIEDYDLVAVTEAVKYSKESKSVAKAAEKKAEQSASTVSSAVKPASSTAQTTSASKSSSSKKSSRKSKTQKAQQTVDGAFKQPAVQQPDEVVAKSFKDRKINPSQVAAVDLYVGHPVKKQGVKRYVVAQAGDTYKGIAAEFNIELKRILRYNGANDYSKPAPGQKVWLNCKAPKK